MSRRAADGVARLHTWREHLADLARQSNGRRREARISIQFAAAYDVEWSLGLIALVVGWVYNPYAAMVEAFGRALQAAGKKIMLIQIEDDRALDMIVDDLAGYRIDGVVSALSILSEEAAAAISAHRIPVILLNSGLISDWVRVVETNNRGAGRAAARDMVDVAPVALPGVGGRSVASAAR